MRAGETEKGEKAPQVHRRYAAVDLPDAGSQSMSPKSMQAKARDKRGHTYNPPIDIAVVLPVI
jgi:hypothetical protein